MLLTGSQPTLNEQILPSFGILTLLLQNLGDKGLKGCSKIYLL